MISRAGREARTAALIAVTVYFALLPWTSFATDWQNYILPLGTITVALVTVSAIGRSLGIARSLVLLVGLLVATEGILVTVVGQFWPDGSSWTAFTQSLSESVTVARQYAAPVPHGVTGLATLMILLGVAIIFMFDFVAGTLRRPGLAGLLLLAVQTTTGALLDEPLNWGLFLVSALAFAALLASVRELDLLAWSSLRRGERQTRRQSTERFNTRVAWLRIGLTATALALVAPLVVPMLGSGTYSALKTGPGGGNKGVGLQHPFLDMKKNLVENQNVPLVRVSSMTRPSYFRIAVLDQFDGKTWTQATNRDFTPLTPQTQVPGVSQSDRAGNQASFQVTTFPAYDATTLPVPYPPGVVESDVQQRGQQAGGVPMYVDPGTWEVEPQPGTEVKSGYQYTISQYQQVLHPAQLKQAPNAPQAIQDYYTQLPANTPSWVKQIADQVTASANGNKYEEATLLQDWFRNTGGFTYSLQAGTGSGLDQLHHFVTDNKVGYCEQFSTAMALFGRALGIPSRVVLGFRAPQASAFGGWGFGTKDLHAWPEMYFPGAGWVKFEPTPNVLITSDLSYTNLAPGLQPPSTTSSPTTAVTTPPPSTATPPPAGSTSSQGGFWSGTVSRALVWLLIVVVLGILGALPRSASWALRRWRWNRASSPQARAEVAWREVTDLAEDLGYEPPDTSPTLRRHAAELSSEIARTDPVAGPTTGAAISRLALEVEAARYAPEYRGVATLEEDLDRTLKGLDASVGPRRRRRATWWPAAVFKRR